MEKTRLLLLAMSLLSCALLAAEPAPRDSQPKFVTIGSGDPTGVYYPTGLLLAKMLNAKRDAYGIRATVEATRGSVFNINAIVAGYMALGLAQSDKQYQAVKGLAEWAVKGPQTELRSVFSLHHEYVTLVAAVDAGIQTIAHLKGNRVNLGNTGSGQLQNARDALKASGLRPGVDIRPQYDKCAEALAQLQDRVIDAFFCTLGHPSETLRQLAAGSRQVRFIPIRGAGIDRLIAQQAYYSKATIRVADHYSWAAGAMDVNTFGVKAVLCASAQLSHQMVYALTKEVFENLESFKRQHPALASLNKAEMLTGFSAPLHPGAARYFKEIGLLQ